MSLICGRGKEAVEEEVKVAAGEAVRAVRAVGARAGEVQVRVLLLGMYHLPRIGVEAVVSVAVGVNRETMGELEVVLLRRHRRRIKLEVLQLHRKRTRGGSSGVSLEAAAEVQAQAAEVRAILTVDLEVRHQQVAAPHHHPQAGKQRLVPASPLDSGAPMPAAQKYHIQLAGAQLQGSPRYCWALV